MYEWCCGETGRNQDVQERIPRYGQQIKGSVHGHLSQDIGMQQAEARCIRSQEADRRITSYADICRRLTMLTMTDCDFRGKRKQHYRNNFVENRSHDLYSLTLSLSCANGKFSQTVILHSSCKDIARRIAHGKLSPLSQRPVKAMFNACQPKVDNPPLMVALERQSGLRGPFQLRDEISV